MAKGKGGSRASVPRNPGKSNKAMVTRTSTTQTRATKSSGLKGTGRSPGSR
jgi:hypothetical protein